MKTCIAHSANAIKSFCIQVIRNTWTIPSCGFTRWFSAVDFWDCLILRCLSSRIVRENINWERSVSHSSREWLDWAKYSNFGRFFYLGQFLLKQFTFSLSQVSSLRFWGRVLSMKLKPELLTFGEYLEQNKIDLFLKMGHSHPLLMSILCLPRPTEVSSIFFGWKSIPWILCADFSRNFNLVNVLQG